jgi:hypothetical protein
VHFQIARLDRDLPGDPGRNGGMVDEGRAVADSGEDAGRPQHDIGQVIVVADTGQHHVRAFGCFGRAGRDPHGKAGVGFLPARGAFRAAVVDGQAVSGLADVPRNRAAHHAQPQKRYVARCGHGRCVGDRLMSSKVSCIPDRR